MIRKSYIDSQGKIVCPMNGANYLTLRGKLTNWTSEDILKVMKDNVQDIDLGDAAREHWETFGDSEEDNKEEDNNGSNSGTIVGEWETI